MISALGPLRPLLGGAVEPTSPSGLRTEHRIGTVQLVVLPTDKSKLVVHVEFEYA